MTKLNVRQALENLLNFHRYGASACGLLSTAVKEAEESLAVSQTTEPTFMWNSHLHITQKYSSSLEWGSECVRLYTEDQVNKMIEDARLIALQEAINVIEHHEIPVGNSSLGELACEWTYDALKDVRDKVRNLK